MVTVFSKNVSEDTSTAPVGFRRGYGEHAIDCASKIKSVLPTTTQEILSVAKNLVEIKTRLNRKEFSLFLKNLLCWTKVEARKYLDIGRVFGGFDFKALASIEPFLLLRLCAKKFAPVVEALRGQSELNPIRVAELIQELIPKQPTKKKAETDLGDAILQKHANAVDGKFYYNLKSVNLNEETGSWLEEKLRVRTVGQVLSEARMRELGTEADGYTTAQIEEFQKTVSSLRERQIQQELQLQQRDARIAELEAQLAEKPTTVAIKEQIELLPQEPEPVFEQEPSVETLFSQFADWSEIAKAVECDRNQFMKLAKTCSESERRHISDILSNFLETDSLALDQLCWVPENLLKSALSRLCFSVQQIVGGDSPNEDPRFEMVSGCTLANIQNFGNRRECWIFELPNGKRVPIFGRDEFLIEVF